jgi:hypothetical protein
MIYYLIGLIAVSARDSIGLVYMEGKGIDNDSHAYLIANLCDEYKAKSGIHMEV